MKTIFIAALTLILVGCASPQPTWLGNPILTPEQVEEGKKACLKNKTDPSVYPDEKTPVKVFCKVRSVLPKGYVSPFITIRVL